MLNVWDVFSFQRGSRWLLCLWYCWPALWLWILHWFSPENKNQIGNTAEVGYWHMHTHMYACAHTHTSARVTSGVAFCCCCSSASRFCSKFRDSLPDPLIIMSVFLSYCLLSCSWLAMSTKLHLSALCVKGSSFGLFSGWSSEGKKRRRTKLPVHELQSFWTSRNSNVISGNISSSFLGSIPQTCCLYFHHHSFLRIMNVRNELCPNFP